MYKNIISGSLILSMFCMNSWVFADESGENSCKYLDKLQQCKIANKNGSARSIDEFICLQSGNDEEILYQIILDEQFTEVQEEKLKFLKQLDQNKEATLTDRDKVIDEISKLGLEGYYHTKYKKICNAGILEERAKCGNIPIVSGGKIIKNTQQKSECLSLAKTHLNIYESVAYDRMGLNKAQAQKDQYKKDITQVLRGKFDALLNMMADIVGFTGRMARGITHWTGNPKQ